MAVGLATQTLMPTRPMPALPDRAERGCQPCSDTQHDAASLAAPQSLTEARANLTLMPMATVPEPPDCAARGHPAADARVAVAPRRANLTGALARAELIPSVTLPERPE